MYLCRDDMGKNHLCCSTGGCCVDLGIDGFFYFDDRPVKKWRFDVFTGFFSVSYFLIRDDYNSEVFLSPGQRIATC